MLGRDKQVHAVASRAARSLAKKADRVIILVSSFFLDIARDEGDILNIHSWEQIDIAVGFAAVYLIADGSVGFNQDSR